MGIEVARFELISLAPVYIIYEERATFQLRLDCQHLYNVPAVDWGRVSVMRDGTPPQRRTPMRALCCVERVEGVARYPPLEWGSPEGAPRRGFPR